MQAKLEAQLRGLGGGFLPEPMARPYIEAGHLVERRTERAAPLGAPCIAPGARPPPASRAARCNGGWSSFEHEGTRRALLERHRGQ